MKESTKRFRIAFSFSGAKRNFVAQVAQLLANCFGSDAILYDKFHEAEFARRDLGFRLPDLYHDESDLIVLVICNDYECKEWCGLEWDAIFDLLKNRGNDDVMLCRFDRATIKGLYSTSGFLDLDDRTPELTSIRILERLALNEGRSKNHYLPQLARGAPQTVNDYYNRALRCLADQAYDAAIELLNETVQLDPSRAHAFYNRGLAHFFKRDEDSAIEDFDQALELGFDDAILYRNRANAFSRKGDVERALADYERAIQLEPDNPLAYLNRGEVHANTLRKALAIADYELILKLKCDPKIQEVARERLLSLGVKAVVPDPATSP